MNQPVIRVFILDDSALVRRRFGEAFAADPRFEVIGTATDPFAAARKLAKIRPDVITLDLELPRMHGLSFLERLMAQHPLPVVVCSSHPEQAQRALDLGAVAAVSKPGHRDDDLSLLLEAVARAGRGTVRRRHAAVDTSPSLSADAVLPRHAPERAFGGVMAPIIAIGASTGGTEAIERVLGEFPVDAPATVITQHMPAGFTRAFARRLDECSAPSVREAQNGDRLEPGTVLIAPGHAHMIVRRAAQHCFVEVREGPPVSRHCPSVDVLFRSVAASAGANAIAALLTGMGSDGARGLLELQQSGAFTLAQDEATSVVFGMPREAIALGAARLVRPLPRIASSLLAEAARRSALAA